MPVNGREVTMSQQTLRILRTRDDREIPVAGEYTIDPAHTSVEFVGRHLMITRVRGRFPEVSGIVTIDDEPERSHVEVQLEVASLDTGNVDRDAHLRSADFFDADQHPTITFRSSNVEAIASGTWAVTGDLTVRDVTRPITLQVDFDGANASPMGDERVAFSAAADVDREDWGLTWNVALESGGLLVGKKVRIELNIQAVSIART
jgi:polyisoprenoid-binding protein YceI